MNMKKVMLTACALAFFGAVESLAMEDGLGNESMGSVSQDSESMLDDMSLTSTDMSGLGAEGIPLTSGASAQNIFRGRMIEQMKKMPHSFGGMPIGAILGSSANETMDAGLPDQGQMFRIRLVDWPVTQTSEDPETKLERDLAEAEDRLQHIEEQRAMILNDPRRTEREKASMMMLCDNLEDEYRQDIENLRRRIAHHQGK